MAFSPARAREQVIVKRVRLVSEGYETVEENYSRTYRRQIWWAARVLFPARRQFSVCSEVRSVASCRIIVVVFRMDRGRTLRARMPVSSVGRLNKFRIIDPSRWPAAVS
jgi:hypothetical protein